MDNKMIHHEEGMFGEKILFQRTLMKNKRNRPGVTNHIVRSLLILHYKGFFKKKYSVTELLKEP